MTSASKSNVSSVRAPAARSEELIAILDAGAQYGKLIDRRVRELGVRSEMLPLDISASELIEGNYVGVIISGGPHSLSTAELIDSIMDPKVFDLGLPIFGICYGMQIMNAIHGGRIDRKHIREDGQFEVTYEASHPLFEGLASPDSTSVLLTHGDSVGELAEQFDVIAQAKDTDIVAAIAHKTKALMGVQFHPEVDLTVEGRKMFHNFLFNVCKCSGSFTSQCRMQSAIAEIQHIVGDKQVLLLASGGVDSSVCAALLSKALPPSKVYALHVDSGFMRYNESAKVEKALSVLDLNLCVVNATERFFNATTHINGKETKKLCDTMSPEEKRKIIGDTFMHVSQAEIRRLGLDIDTCFLAQGTLRPDLIESASSIASTSADVIKTHHNDTNLVRLLRDKGRIVEPLRDFHKDEVRELGHKLGLPPHLIWRQPFPGPGLAIRIICAEEPYSPPCIDATRLRLKSFADKYGVGVHLLPCRTVGVQGDERSYCSAVALTGKRDWDVLFRLARLIPKEVHSINRVVYAFHQDDVDELPFTITPTHLQHAEVAQLQLADEIVNDELFKHDLVRSLSQVPVILFPASFGQEGKRSITIRTFITNDFMTGTPATPGVNLPIEVLDTMVSRILAEVPGIACVCFDLTSKPPGTTEWE